MPEQLHTAESSTGRHSFSVAHEEAGLRLDRYLAVHFPQLSRTCLQELVDGGRVRVRGVACKRSHRVETGDTVEIEIPAPTAPGVEPEAIALEVLYEDDDLAVVNKPAGMIVHPGAGAAAGTLVGALLHRFGRLSSVGGPMRPGIVHRLDKGTSGALVIARNDEAHRRLVEEFQDRTVEKTYVALLHGRLKDGAGKIDLPVARDLRRRTRMTARRREGRPAHTEWRVLERLGGFTLVEARLHTGRTHQLRVHFAALGHPVVGDTLYGAPRVARAGAATLEPLGRNFLHAARLRFIHPRSGQPVTVRAPLPKELRAYLERLRHALGADPASIDAALRDYL